MTCLNPHAHHISLTQSQSWDWRVQAIPLSALPPTAKMRHQMLTWHQSHGRNVSKTCRHFGTSRPTFYRWQKRVHAQGSRGLLDRSHRPHQVSLPTWSHQDVLAVRDLRMQYPYMGKDKLAVLLKEDRGIDLSVSMVGRILTHLRRSGQIPLPPRLFVRRRRSILKDRPHAVRKPKDYQPTEPGDLVQIDTVDVALPGGTRVKQLSLVDVVSRYAAAEVKSGKTAVGMRDCMKRMRERLPFAVRAIQIDGGSEFKAAFETYCQEEGIALFVLPPRSPKLNGKVERLQRTFRDEFYACEDLEPRVGKVAEALAAYEHTYNHVRPHRSLQSLTPAQFIETRRHIQREV